MWFTHQILSLLQLGKEEHNSSEAAHVAYQVTRLRGHQNRLNTMQNNLLSKDCLLELCK